MIEGTLKPRLPINETLCSHEGSESVGGERRSVEQGTVDKVQQSQRKKKRKKFAFGEKIDRGKMAVKHVFQLGEWVRAKEKKATWIGWRQTRTKATANHMVWLVSGKKIAQVEKKQE